MNDTIEEDELATNQELRRDLYHNPASGYRSIEFLYRKARDAGFKVSREQVRNFLKTQDTYTKTFPKGGPGLGKKTYRPTVVGDLGQQLQMDLVDMTKIRAVSYEGNRWILTFIEVLFRFAFTKSGEDTKKSMEIIFEDLKEKFVKYPDVVQFDDGNEFNN